jgi:hypothetical protein
VKITCLRAWLARRMLPVVVLVLAPGGAAGAQETGSGDGESAVLSDSARISIVTILPGRKVYSLFGHNALRVFDPGRGIDIAYNYGTFDFGNPLVFSARFAYGDLNYRLTRQNYERMVAFYPVEEGRPVIEQILDLDARQREEIFQFLEWNAQPENAYYRYDFYYDNCATRIRDVLEETLGERLLVGSPDPGGTMRQLLDPYLVERSWLHFGMDAGQGTPADAEATWRSELFLPDRLASWAAVARVVGENGARPLVARTDSIGWTADRVRLRPALNWPFILLVAVLAFVAWITILDLRSGRQGRAWLDIPFFGLLGLTGLLVFFLWFISVHQVTKRNVNLMWALPSNLVLVWGVARTGGKLWVELLLWGTAAASLLFVLGWPLWTQEVPLATLPLAAAVVIRTAGLALAKRRAGGAA